VSTLPQQNPHRAGSHALRREAAVPGVDEHEHRNEDVYEEKRRYCQTVSGQLKFFAGTAAMTDC